MSLFIDWIMKALDLGPTCSLMADPAMASAARSAVNALTVLLRNQFARVAFTKAGGMQRFDLLF
jgi:hypothetical protein